MKTDKRNWYKNEWVVAIGSGIVLLLIPLIFDLIRGEQFNHTLEAIWSYPVKLGYAIIALAIIVSSSIILQRMPKVLYNPLFEEGTQVILKTNHRPVMVTGKVDEKTNSVLCNWTVNREIKSEWINQNLLKPYEEPEYIPRATRPSQFWRY